MKRDTKIFSTKPFLLSFLIIVSLAAGLLFLLPRHHDGSPVTGPDKSSNNQRLFEFLDSLVEARFYSTDTNIEHMVIADHKFWIPENYIMSPYEDKPYAQGILLQVLLPNMEPRTQDNIDQFTKGNGHQNRSRILIQNLQRRTDTRFVLDKVFEWNPSMREIDRQFDLHHFYSQTSNPAVPHFEAYIDGTPSDFKSFILCTPHELEPGCAHHFQHEGLYIEVSYSKRYLGDWRRLQQNTIDLLKHFNRDPSQEGSR